jgi:hypothetical protein
MAGDELIEPSREMRKYLVPTERIIVKQRQHVVVITLPTLVVVGWLILIGVLDTQLPADSLAVRNVAIWIWFGILLWAGWKFLFWWKDDFIATNKRLLKTYGVFTRKVAMMPMGKVTDMTYTRTAPGRLFGWGKFIVESAGQDQALSVINFVVQPDVTYRKITSEIFAPSAPKPSTSTSGSGKGSPLPVAEPDEVWWKK